ncbi:MAG: tRNA lysidine(34) synthetase TilS [Lachnospiraceae bacterium]|nr:tRNA lysidine(34) synthetase TilS [Lachnospiraceae bacterium]
MLHLASLAAQADAYFATEAEKILGDNKTQIQTAVFDRQQEIMKNYLVRAMIAAAAGQEKDITARHVDAVCELTGPGGGTCADLPYGLQAVRRYETLEIRKKEEISPGNVDVSLEMQVFPWKKDLEIPKNQYTKWFDYDKIKGTLCVRSRESGDYFFYSGEKRKLLKRYFIDEKIPEEMRDGIPLLADGSHILWVIGYRISEHYKITENTRTILQVTLCKGEK